MPPEELKGAIPSQKEAYPHHVKDILMSELSGSRDTIASLLKSSDQVLTVGGTVLVSVSVVFSGFFSPQQSDFPAIVLSSLPFIFGLLAAYWIRVRTAINSLGGYKAAIEERLMSCGTQRRAVLWESGGVKSVKGRFGYVLNMYFIFAAFLFIVVLAAVYTGELFDQDKEHFRVTYWAILVFQCTGLFFAFLDSSKVFDDTRKHFLQIIPESIIINETQAPATAGENAGQ